MMYMNVSYSELESMDFDTIIHLNATMKLLKKWEAEPQKK